MKALRRIDNLLFLVALVPTELKGSQAIARAVNVRARRPRRKRGTNCVMCGTEVLAGLCRDIERQAQRQLSAKAVI